jgi:hypothetical protein
MLGNGTSITKIKPTAAMGMIHSVAELFPRAEGAVVVTVVAMAYLPPGAPAPAFCVCDERLGMA